MHSSFVDVLVTNKMSSVKRRFGGLQLLPLMDTHNSSSHKCVANYFPFPQFRPPVPSLTRRNTARAKYNASRRFSVWPWYPRRANLVPKLDFPTVKVECAPSSSPLFFFLFHPIPRSLKLNNISIKQFVNVSFYFAPVTSARIRRNIRAQSSRISM